VSAVAAALSAVAAALSPVIEALSFIIVLSVAVDEVSSVFGLLWQAANVSILPTNKRANTFFILPGRLRFEEQN